MAIPVRPDGRAIAVLAGSGRSARSGRQPGELERTYIATFERFAAMIAEGLFPFSGPVADSSAAPRVGDGALVLDGDARVLFGSPNAVSALHRVGITANAVGLRLAELGFNDSPVRHAFETGLPVIEEFEQTPEVTFLARCIPSWPVVRSPVACSCCATSPRSASATSCCSARTPRSARSITG